MVDLRKKQIKDVKLCQVLNVISMDDLEIMGKCKKLEKLNLTQEDDFMVNLIKAQLGNDWREFLLKKLDQLLEKYRRNVDTAEGYRLGE